MNTRKRIAALASAAAVLAGTAQLVPAGGVAAADIDYAKALQMSLYFYECQQAGHLPEWNRVEWRADSTVDDDVDGGWYDAGDHVKFNLPMAYSASMLAWGLYEYPEAVEKCGEMTNYVNNLKWVLDYFVRCDLGDSVIYQVGNGQDDHAWWGPVELLEYGMKAQNIGNGRGHSEGRDCSAVTAEMGAALAAGYCALQGRVDSATLEGYLKSSKNFLKMADADRSDAAYMKSDAKNFYQSSHFYDELFYCSNWLYIATKDKAYLDQAASYIPNLGVEQGQTCLKYSWAQCWDDVQQGGTLLYAINTGDPEWIAQAKKHLDYWTDGDGKRLKDGLCYVHTWGCLRYAASIGFTAAVACDHLFKDDARYPKYKELYETQINYILGDNQNKVPYVVGYSDNAPSHPHHRTAHGSWKNSDESPEESRHILYGALVGGPNEDGSYVDKRNNFVNNEVATDYNAGFTALLCKMINDYGGKSDPKFPYPEKRDEEFFVCAKGTHDSGGSTLSLKITNHTAWPARVVDNISMRYFFDGSELKAAGYDPTKIVIRVDRDQSEMYKGDGVKSAVISEPKQYEGDIYYIEFTFPDGRAFMPISEGQHQCEIMVALQCPDYGKGWDAKNDFSATGLATEANEQTMYVPVYENGTLIYGKEPNGSVGKGSISGNPAPDGNSNIQTSGPDKTTTTTSKTTTTTTSKTTTTTTVTTTTVTTTQTTGTSGPDNNPVMYGDLNCDDTVDIKDAVMLARLVGGDTTVTVSSRGRANADCNGSGKVDAGDLTKLLRFLAKLIPASDLGKA